MTPQEFAAAYRPCANQVSADTGIDPIALLSQWANETNWGAAVFGNNMGNIRCSPTSFCLYATLDDFAIACIATFHNGYYQPVLDATNAVDQLAAIVASPWSAGHYGGSLAGFYSQLEAYEMTPEEHQWLADIHQAIGSNPTVPGQTMQGGIGQIEADVTIIKAKIGAGGGTEPPEPAEPKAIILTINSVPGTATGTIS